MSTFKVGQKVVCVKKGPWRMIYQDGTIGEREIPGPKNGDIVTVLGAGYVDGYIALVEWRGRMDNSWSIERFRPITPPSVHQELIEQFELSQVPEAPELIPQTA